MNRGFLNPGKCGNMRAKIESEFINATTAAKWQPTTRSVVCAILESGDVIQRRAIQAQPSLSV